MSRKYNLLLAIDVGNSEITWGVFNNDIPEHKWRVETNLTKTSDEYGIELEQVLHHFGYNRQMFGGVIISSVVPDMVRKLTAMVKRFMQKAPVVVGQDTRIGLDIRTEAPKRVGADRIVNAVGGYHFYGGPLVIVDIGTAITHDVVSSKGEFLGGSIAPGIGMAAESLASDTAMLPRICLDYPDFPIGRNTTEAMRTGLVLGYIALIDGITKAIIDQLEEMGEEDPKVIATGGFSSLISMNSKYINQVDRDLTLRGLRVIYDLTAQANRRKRH